MTQVNGSLSAWTPLRLNVYDTDKNIPHWPLPAVRDLTRDGRWSTYDVSVLSCLMFQTGENAHAWETL